MKRPHRKPNRRQWAFRIVFFPIAIPWCLLDWALWLYITPRKAHGDADFAARRLERGRLIQRRRQYVDYRAYLASQEWAERARRCKERAGWICKRRTARPAHGTPITSPTSAWATSWTQTCQALCRVHHQALHFPNAIAPAGSAALRRKPRYSGQCWGGEGEGHHHPGTASDTTDPSPSLTVPIRRTGQSRIVPTPFPSGSWLRGSCLTRTL